MRKHRFYLFIITGFIIAGITLQHPTSSQAQTDSQARAQADAWRATALSPTRLGAASVSGNLDGSATTVPSASSSSATDHGITVALVWLHDASILPPPTTTTTTTTTTEPSR